MSSLYHAIMGFVVGDALGVPVEFKKRDTYEVSSMIGYGTYHQPPGTWSDDSSMTLATLESMARLGKIDWNDLMENFFSWYEHGDFTPYQEVFDIGGATRNAMERYCNGASPLECGGTSVMDNGNGSLMRILPLAFVAHSVEDIYNVSALTHAHPISKTACVIYIAIAKALMNGMDKETAWKKACSLTELPEFSRLPDLQDLPREKIKSSGYVVDTLEAAFWCLLNTNTYQDCVLTAVNLGEDTDTVAAIAGGLAGILYGIGGELGIPEAWIDQIARKDWIEELCRRFEKAIFA